MKDPLVSVICLCYNQERYVAEALLSVLNQTYPRIELIVVDDASTDKSTQVIRKVLAGVPDAVFIRNRENLGNCRSFNKGLEKATGDFVIDFSMDDVLVKNRVEAGVKAFESHSMAYGVHFTDAEYIDEYSRTVGYHYRRDAYGSLLDTVPEGNAYRQLVEKYLICTPTMMMRRSLLLKLNGYDESLAYEDFDFWVRSARITKYIYTDQVLVKKRVLEQSLSKSHYRDPVFMKSTLAVCRKAFDLNESEKEDGSLKKRIRYEMRQCVIRGHYEIAAEFLKLLRQLNVGFVVNWSYTLLIRLRPDLRFLTRWQRPPK